MIRNLQFIVEGKTEGQANAFGKGLQNILRTECDFMRQRGVRYHTIRKGGKRALLDDVAFDVSQHLNPPQKVRAKLARQGSAPGDYVFILRDLDCGDEDITRDEILARIASEFSSRVEIHFAVQEIEAWLLADPEGFCSVYHPAPAQLLAHIKRLVPQGQSPEVALDCNPVPSEYLADAARRHGRAYRKTIEGPQALGLVDADLVADRCPHFKQFRDSLRMRIGWQQQGATNPSSVLNRGG